jgi:replicative DNA helicase
MDIDKGLISSLVREGYSPFLDQGIDKDMIQAEYHALFDFIENHWRDFGKVPEIETLYREFGVDLSMSPKEPMSFWAKEIRNRKLYEGMRGSLAGAIKLLEERKPEEALKEMENVVFESRKTSGGQARAVSVFSKTKEILDNYEKSKLGITGIPTPWDTLTHITRGWHPGDLCIFAARPGSGKTWALLIMARWAWLKDKRILMGSTEMSSLSLSKRTSAIATKTSYGKLNRGSLDSASEEKFKVEMEKLKDDDRFLLMGDGFDVTLEAVEASILEKKPHLVCLDGIYLFKSSKIKARDRMSRIAEIIEQTKSMAKRLGVPIIVTTQMNRAPKEGTGNKKADLDRLAFSDNMGMVADYVFFINQTKEMRENKELEIQPVKTRESEYMEAFKINWDFENQNFDQKSDPPKADYSSGSKKEKDIKAAEEWGVKPQWMKYQNIPEDDPF